MEDILDQHYSFHDPIELNEHRDVDRPGLKCELRTYESRYNAKGERVALHVGSRQELRMPRGRDHDSALVLTRFYDKARELERTELEVQSPHIKAALRHVIKKYPSINMDGKDLIIADLPKCLFHYRIELQSYRESINDQTAAEHIDFALRYMEQILQTQIWNWFNFVDIDLLGLGEKDPATLDVGLEFADLWMAFRPGSLVYTKDKGTENILRLKDMTRCTCVKPHCFRKKWTIVGEQIIFDGDEFGYESFYFSIYPYEGHIPFRNLKIFPLQYHPDKDDLMYELKERGKKYVSLRGAVHQDYDGVAECLSMFRMNSFVGEEDFFPLQSTMIKGRVMVDTRTFGLINPGNKVEVDEHLEPEKTTDSDSDLPNFDDEDLMICSYCIPGFSLANKRWGFFNVGLLKNVEFRKGAFPALILPEFQKEMIRSLVTVHSDENLSFDDVINGKGKGMVFLLHGVPGVGKTLTAESVADFTERPLYTISSGELGTDPKSMENSLSVALQLATIWKAIVLIDEADVFLEQRSAKDLKRNGLVSIFLRLLEYYEGILFLTTNRIQFFDKAFKSRIHLAIKYHPLAPSARAKLWELFIRNTYPDSNLEWMDASCLERLGNANLNGREIKNAFRTGHALAVHSREEFNISHIELALEGIQNFEADFDSAEDESLSEDESQERGKKRRRRDW